MGNKIVMSEVSSAQELQVLDGCTITAVYGYGEDKDEGLCLDCRDRGGNLVNFLITKEGTWHLHDGKEDHSSNSEKAIKRVEQKVEASVQPVKCMICKKEDHVEGARYCTNCGQSFANPPQEKCECGKYKFSRHPYCCSCGKKNW